MIQAALHKKIRPKRKDYVEDEYTSCVFGEISHYPVEKVWNFFSTLHLCKTAREDINHNIPKAVEFRFWPNFNNVEPDLVVDFYADTERKECLLHIIIEVKWNAPLSPDCELIRQWCNRDCQDGVWRHIYLTKTNSSGRKGISQTVKIIENSCNSDCKKCTHENHKDDLHRYNARDMRELKNNLYFVTWTDIAQYADKNGFTGVSCFLSAHGIGHFVGFRWLNEYNTDVVLQQSSNTKFYQENPWWGFIGDIECVMNTTTQTMFFNFIMEVFTMDGNVICQAVQIVDKVGGQVELMLDKCTEQIERLIDSNNVSFFKKAEICGSEFEHSSETEWVVGVALAQVGLIPNNKRKVTAFIAFEVVLFDEYDSIDKNWQPAIYVMYAPCCDGFDIADIRLTRKDDVPLKLSQNPKKLCWDQNNSGKPDSWVFVVPLVKINNEDDIKTQIIDPVVKLLNNADGDVFPDSSVAFNFEERNGKIEIV